MLRKPNPVIFELALHKAGLQANDVWFCGDNLYADVYGANTVGIFPVHYDNRSIENPWKHADNEIKPDFEYLHINSWLEMIDVLEKLFRKE